jgi:hypothetical protein
LFDGTHCKQHERVTTLADGFDGKVKRMPAAYDDRGMISAVIWLTLLRHCCSVTWVTPWTVRATLLGIPWNAKSVMEEGTRAVELMRTGAGGSEIFPSTADASNTVRKRLERAEEVSRTAVVRARGGSPLPAPFP